MCITMSRTAIALLVSLCCSLSHANTLTNIAASSDGVQIDLAEPITFDPRNFSATSTKIVIDLDDTDTPLGRTVTINTNTVQMVNVVKGSDRIRLVITLTSPAAYTVISSGTKLLVSLVPAKQPEITMVATKTPLDLIAEARLIVESGVDLDRAVEPLNGILMLAPGEYTEEAQEMIGAVDERLKLYERAKSEYKLFLAMFPNSKSYTRIKERLIALEIAEPLEPVVPIAQRKPKLGKEQKVDASIAEYYITGGNSINDQPLRTDQSTLISNIRAGATFKDDQYLLKLAYRQSRIDNFFNTSASRDLLTLGYVDFQDTFRDRGIKVGRQNAAYGAIGRFDGVTANVGLDDARRVIIVAGSPYIGPTNTTRQFIGGAYEIIWDDKWSSDVYYNYQTADQITERSAIGSTIRYVKGALSSMAAAEYDTLYNAVNSFTLQVNYQPDPYNIYLLADSRKSPMLFAERSLLLGLNSPSKLPYGSVGEAFGRSGMSASDIYQFVNKSTATANAYVVGVGKQVNPMWNIGVDYQITNMTGATDTSFIPSADNPFSLIEQPATDTTNAVNFRVLGTDVWTRGHTVNGVLSHSTTGATSEMYIVTLLNGMQFNIIRVDLMVMAMTNTQPFTTTSAMTYSLRSNYRLTSSSIETQLMWTDTSMTDRTSGASTKSASVSLVVGWKIDF
jgi:hypothetical protein